jgi:transcriptional regulator with XRE-family HTH domain
VRDPDLDPAEVRRKELARFLRARREALSPEELGLPRHKRRRTPGLRREEVAALAGIGAAWYARLESAHDVTPSTDTLLAIARSLRLNEIETEYAFELAGFGVPKFHQSLEGSIPETIEQLVPVIPNVGAIFFDRYLTALRWNAIGDAMFGLTMRGDPADRNTVRAMIADPRMPEVFGSDFERLAGGLIAMFRRAYLAAEPTPFARKLHEEIVAHPRLSKFWEERMVADNVFDDSGGPFQRHHPVLGSFSILTTNMIVSRQQGTILRVMVPADEASKKQFERLATLGKPSTRDTRLP